MVNLCKMRAMLKPMIGWINGAEDAALYTFSKEVFLTYAWNVVAVEQRCFVSNIFGNRLTTSNYG
jgi:hypothetical protein